MSDPQAVALNNPVTTAGTFVWHELATPDLNTARTFYTELFGWGINVADMGDMGMYTTFVQDETPVAGLVKPPGDPEAAAHWITYATVPDLDAAIQFDGVHVRVPPTAIPDGRYALITDPTGAVIGPFQGQVDNPPAPDAPPAVGTFCWHELMTPDTTQSAAFYNKLFGWTTKAVDMGETGTYWLFRHADRDAAGMMEVPDAPPGWLCYIAVEDADATVAQAEALGAQVHVAPRDIPDVGRFAVLQDPTGAGFAVLAF